VRKGVALGILLLACTGCGRERASKSAEAAVASRPSPAAFALVDVTEGSGVAFVSRSGSDQQFIPEAKGTGVAILDYDRDGILDLFFVSGSTIERERAFPSSVG
jgi:hypothetical protein